MEEEVVAVLVNLQVFESALQYMATQPFNAVSNLIQSLQQSQGLTATQINNLTDQDNPEEEAPE